MSGFGLLLRFGEEGSEYLIYEKLPGILHGMDDDGNDAGIVWRRPYREDEDLGGYSWPADMRAEYERLTGKPEFDPAWDGGSQVNLVELIDDSQGFNQPCAFGNLCEGHAVYCHNDGWLYSPRKVPAHLVHWRQGEG
jgi:hypothetical protein